MTMCIPCVKVLPELLVGAKPLWGPHKMPPRALARMRFRQPGGYSVLATPSEISLLVASQAPCPTLLCPLPTVDLSRLGSAGKGGAPCCYDIKAELHYGERMKINACVYVCVCVCVCVCVRMQMLACWEDKGRKGRMKPKSSAHLLSKIDLNRKLSPDEGIEKHRPGSRAVK